jgi:phosphoribosylformimino-5-aminoimidazole carboxamide ribotide isomerase
MQIIPVLDLQDNVVVRGIAGRRSEYRPIVSRLTPSAAPLAVADALRAHFGFELYYLADLDAIAGAAPARQTYNLLISQGFRLWVDAGIRDMNEIAALNAAAVAGVVVGLETLPDSRMLAEACRDFEKRIIFSLDLKQGRPLAVLQGWSEMTPWEIAIAAVERGVQRMIVLDVAQVGMGGGTGTEELCGQLANRFPDLEVIAGGGVRDSADLTRLERCGVKAALVASALHDGRLTPRDLARFSGPPFVGR